MKLTKMLINQNIINNNNQKGKNKVTTCQISQQINHKIQMNNHQKYQKRKINIQKYKRSKNSIKPYNKILQL
jgi:hypothetical protein